MPLKKHRKLPILTDKQFKRFWFFSNRDNHTPDECWLWLSCRDHRGAPMYSCNFTSYSAARLSYTMRYGEIPEELVVSHLCGNGHLGCVNPSHLIAETIAENNARKIEHGTNTPGEQHWNAQHTWEQINEMRKLRAENPEYWTYKRLAEKFNYKLEARVWEILANRTWKI